MYNFIEYKIGSRHEGFCNEKFSTRKTIAKGQVCPSSDCFSHIYSQINLINYATKMIILSRNQNCRVGRDLKVDLV